MISEELIQRLRYQGESDSLDFKREQYAFASATDDKKSELLKDVLAFANSWKRSDAFILIGFNEVPGDVAEISGISEHIDDAQLQQFVNSKTQKPLAFRYQSIRIENTEVAILHIPVQERPFYVRQAYGRVAANTVYVRRGSSTAIASPDEVARMGRAEVAELDVSLNVFFASPKRRLEVQPTVRSLDLKIPPPKDIPDYDPDAKKIQSPFSALSMPSFVSPMRHVNRDYNRELAKFTKIDRLTRPVWFAVANSGTSTAHDLRLEMLVSGVDAGVKLFDIDQYPMQPRKEYDYSPRPMAPTTHADPELTVSVVENDWLIRCGVDKVQPSATVWFNDPIYFGSTSSVSLACRVKVFADNLRVPHEQILTLPIETTFEQVGLKRIKELENDRHHNSAPFKRWLKELDSEDG